MKEWTTDSHGAEFIHRCMLPLGHEGPCECGECSDYPLELHSYTGENDKIVCPYGDLMRSAEGLL